MTAIQRKLAAERVAEFYHDEFAMDQVADFIELIPDSVREGVVVDIGGGVGYFAAGIQSQLDCKVRVIDLDPESVAECAAKGVSAELGDALSPPMSGDESCVCFNLILHHLVGADEATTRDLQRRALHVWQGRSEALFVNEYIYESFVGGMSGRMIYAITSSKLLSAVGRVVARFVPALRANTFGIGVRFRSHAEWLAFFNNAGYRVEAVRIGAEEPVRPPLRLLLIKAIRRDSFRLQPIA